MSKQGKRNLAVIVVVVPLALWFTSVNPFSDSGARILAGAFFGMVVALITYSILLKIPFFQDVKETSDD